MIRARRASGVTAFLLLASLVLTACDAGLGTGPNEPACVQLPTFAMPRDLPDDFPWIEGTRLTTAEVKKKFVTLEGSSRESVESLFEDFKPELTGKGFDIINTDFEGFEAELYFAKARNLAGIVSLREGPCDGYVKVNVIYDPLETAAGRKAVEKTRRLSGEG